jgi:hypothetical protein
MPEGFHQSEDGTFHKIPAWAMQEADTIAAAFINKRAWDVPVLADAIFCAYKRGLADAVNVTNATYSMTEEQIEKLIAEFRAAGADVESPMYEIHTKLPTTE